MTGEQVTKAILKFLTDRGWSIVTFDFPQGGTGKMLRPYGSFYEKNKGGIVPDIVAVKNCTCLFFENKDRIDIGDFRKVAGLINDSEYKNAISSLLNGYDVECIYYGISLLSAKFGRRAGPLSAMVHFVVGFVGGSAIEFLYTPTAIDM
jgi:hypothetical protein